MSKISGASNKRQKTKSSPARSDKMPAQANEHEFKIVLDKFKVESEYFDFIESVFMDIYPVLMQDIAYTAEELCGEDLWADLTVSAQRQATLCLRHMAQQDDHPLIEVACECCGGTAFQVVQINQ
jgi:hypothetical protein